MALGNGIFAIISLAIIVIVLTQVFIPTAINASQVNWSAGMIALWAVVGLVAVAGFVYNVAAAFGLA